MRELQVLINYNNYGARSDGIFVRFFFSDINFFSSLFDDAVAFLGVAFCFSLICDGIVVFLVVSVILQWRV